MYLASKHSGGVHPGLNAAWTCIALNRSAANTAESKSFAVMKGIEEKGELVARRIFTIRITKRKPALQLLFEAVYSTNVEGANDGRRTQRS